ncbi:MAG: YjgN family protein [Neomegalonema sp.]|nr:YjgN family protein [Neomegalonema sp.]
MAEASGSMPHDAAWERRALYTGKGGKVFWMTFWGVFLTVITLGVYAFWLKSSQRRYYWSNFVVLRDPMEYTGKGIELFIGFLLAMIIVLAYLVPALLLVNFVFVNAGDTSPEALALRSVLNAVAVLPLLLLAPFAIYNAQRYFVTRLRWRGIRFMMKRGAWAYWGRALLWAVAQILTLGLITPLADYRQRRFITDRMSFGDMQFKLNGSAGALYRPYALVAIGTIGLVIAVIMIAVAGPATPPRYGYENEGEALVRTLQGASAGGLVLFIISAILLSLGSIWYPFARFAFFIRNTTVGDTGLTNRLSPWSIIGLVLFTWLMTNLLVIASAVVLIGPGAAVLALGKGNELLVLIGSVLLMFGVIGVMGVAAGCVQMYFNTGMMEKVADNMQMSNPDALGAVKQAPEALAGDAGGFAEAIDVQAF